MGNAELFVNGGAGVYWFDPGDTEGGGNFGGGLQFDVTPTIAIEGAYNLPRRRHRGGHREVLHLSGRVRIRF